MGQLDAYTGLTQAIEAPPFLESKKIWAAVGAERWRRRRRRRRRRQPSRPGSHLQLARRDEAAGAKCRQWYNPVAGDGCNGRPKARCTHPPRRLAAAPVSGIERARAPGVSPFPTHPRLSLPCRKFQSRSNGSVGSERGKGALMNSLPAAEAFGSFRLP